MRTLLRFLSVSSASAIALAALAACSNDPTVNPNGTDTSGSQILFKQVDRIGKPGIKMLYIAYSSHIAYNTGTPANDVDTNGPTIASFVTSQPAGRSAAIASYVSALLMPDALIGDLSNTSGRASYLGWETGGQLSFDCNGLPGTAFGGRSLTDDVVDADLGITFGNLATSTTLTAATPNVGASPPPDDGNEKNGANGTPNLTKQNVACGNKGFLTNQFPYLGNPI
jgi:hypothetical protein